MEDDDHERRPGGFGRPGEISPYNPNAIRGPTGIWNKVVRDHHQRVEQDQRDQVERCLDSWEWAGLQPEKANVWRVFFRYGGRWGLMVIGRDRNGSVNVVTMLSPKNFNSLPNMIRRGNYVQRHR